MPETVDARATDDTPEARFANVFRVGFNASEFVVDAGQQYGDKDQARIHTRVVTGPWYAVQLRAVLDESIREYERRFGPIEER